MGTGYELILYNFDDVNDDIADLKSGRRSRPSPQAFQKLQAFSMFFKRMRDEKLPKVLCLTCEHEFGYDEPPSQLTIAIPWTNQTQPIICNAICSVCAEFDPDTKDQKILAAWRQVLPGMLSLKIGEA